VTADGPGSGAPADEAAASAPRPALRIVRGNPSPEDIAVLTALVVAGAGDGGDGAAPAPRGGWTDRARQFRPTMLTPGLGGWRSYYR
jgi:hypothetical protein